MNPYNIQNLNAEALIQAQSSLISLYMVKKSIETQLIQQIHLNSLYQNIFNGEVPMKWKGQQCQFHQQNQSSTSFKSAPRRPTERKKNPINKTKNDTKNIPKNFGKAIITFVQQNHQIVRIALAKEGVSYETFVAALRTRKRSINTISSLRSLWVKSQFPYSRQMRIISQYFLKRNSLYYVFNSRITDYEGHVKYRGRLIEVLKNPQDFTCIKTN